MSPIRTRTTIALAGALALGLAACGGDTEPAEEPPAVGDPEEEAAEEPEDTEDGEDSEEEADDGEETAENGDLPGEPIEVYPYEGDEIDVVGVAVDDVLHVRDLPDPEADSLAELDPLTEGLVASGHNRLLDEYGMWVELDTGDVTGWSNMTYLGYLGEVEDVTDDFDGIETASSMEELAEEVGELAAENSGAADNPEHFIQIVDGPASGDQDEITVDVLGIPDDSLKGERLHVVATASGSADYQISAVERTLICARGTDEAGLCL